MSTAEQRRRGPYFTMPNATNQPNNVHPKAHVTDNNLNLEAPTQETHEPEYCYCEKDIPDSPMIGCDGPNCHVLPIDLTDNHLDLCGLWLEPVYELQIVLASWYRKFFGQTLYFKALVRCHGKILEDDLKLETPFTSADCESEYCSCGKNIADYLMIGCDGSTFKQQSLRILQSFVNEPIKYTCGLCTTSYSDYITLIQHLYWRHGTESFPCKNCNVKRWLHAPHLCHVVPFHEETFDDDELNPENPTITAERESEYCSCGRNLPDSPMIGCDGPTCERQWFHYACVGVVIVPRGNWFCPECLDKTKKR
ncbi:hypothetical protein SFRURICE_009820 [Spodoptera frugiperda]|nr:hypothetical protein SFRURICE_009820 [Spodoptera frugiperda]